MDGDRPFIVMEYVPGCTLRHIITQEAPLTPVRALDLLEPVVSALASAHEDGLVHRDVKPENVLISDRGQIKVADFGLARAVGNHTMSATSGQLIGTVSYIPPERVTRGSSDERSDIYSAGIVLFEMLTGHKPHTGDSPIQVAWAHVNKDVPAPSQYLANGTKAEHDIAWLVPGYLDSLVRACTSRDPGKRPANGRALLDLLRRVRHALTTGRTDDPALAALQNTVPQSNVVIANPVAHAPAGSTDRSARRRNEPVRPGTASVPPWSRTGTPVSPPTPVSIPDSPLSPIDCPPERMPTQPANHSQPRPRPIHRRATQPASRSRLTQDAVHRRRRGVIAAVFIVLVAVLCAYLVFHFTSSRYSASELHSTNSVARTCVHGESSCMHTVSQNI